VDPLRNLVNKIKPFLYLSLLFSLVLSGGCGYTTRAYNLPPRIKTVYVDTFANQSDQPNIENELRIRLSSEFQDEGHMNITSKNKADAVLTGKVISYSRQAVRFLNDETIQEYRLTISVDFEFADAQTGEVIVSAENFSGDTSYFITGANSKSESTARTDAINELSRRILNKIVTLW
jgi:outer membrane lipopolysaccharide assembly protein LptE/RlpB